MSPGKSRAEIIINSHALVSYTLSMNTLKQRVLDHTPRHRSLTGIKGQLCALVCFIGLIVGFIYSNFER